MSGTTITCTSCGRRFTRGMMRFFDEEDQRGVCKHCIPYGEPSGNAYRGGKVRKWDYDD